jgi:hypothetical protein
MPAIDLEVHFDYNSAVITPQAEPQLRELPPGRCSRWHRRRGDSRDRGGGPRHHRTVWPRPLTSGRAADQRHGAALETFEVGGGAAAGRCRRRSGAQAEFHRTQPRRHVARPGVGQGANGGGCSLLAPVRLLCDQDRRRAVLEEGEFRRFECMGGLHRRGGDPAMFRGRDYLLPSDAVLCAE